MTPTKAVAKTATPKAPVEAPYVPLYTIREVRVDKHTINREIIEIKPSTCPVCGYDVLRSNKDKLPFESTDSLTPETLAIVKQILAKHMEMHSDVAVQTALLRSKDLDRKKQKIADKE